MANCFVIQMRAQQQVASSLDNSCHPGQPSEFAMHKELSGIRTDPEAGSQASTCPGNSSSDSEDLSPATTLIIQNIPFSYTADCLQEELSRASFWGSYDFLYLPSRQRRFESKSALVNFASPSVAQKFRAMFHHGRFAYSGPDDAPLSVVAPPIQGFASCASKHPAGRVYKESAMRFVDSKPTVFLPPPGLESVPFQPPIHDAKERLLGQPCGRGRTPPSSPTGGWHMQSAAAPAGRSKEQRAEQQPQQAGTFPTYLPVPGFVGNADWGTRYIWAEERWTENRFHRAGMSPADAPVPLFVGNARAAAQPDGVQAFYFSL